MKLNREKVLKLIAGAPDSARILFHLGREDGKIVWWWQRLTLVARKRSDRLNRSKPPPARLKI